MADGRTERRYAVVQWPESWGTLRWSVHLVDTSILDLPGKIVVMTGSWQAAHSIANKANARDAIARARGDAQHEMTAADWVKMVADAGPERAEVTFETQT